MAGALRVSGSCFVWFAPRVAVAGAPGNPGEAPEEAPGETVTDTGT